MSIYGRRKGLTGYETIQGEPFMGTAPVDMRPPLDDSRDWSHLRKARPVEVLLPMGERWLRSLPPNVRPQALEAQFPRIVNLIALQWDDRKRCPDYFLELTTDRRRRSPRISARCRTRACRCCSTTGTRASRFRSALGPGHGQG